MSRKKQDIKVIPLGGFCSVAKELERIGLRDGSLPFDWVVTDLKTINTLIRNNFSDLFDPKLLFRPEGSPQVVSHGNYQFDFFHDFNTSETVEEQLASVREKYERRIRRFCEILENSPEVLFVHYPVGGVSSINQDINDFFAITGNYSSNIRLLVVVNRADLPVCEALRSDRVEVIAVDPDEGDDVCRKFMRNGPVKRWVKRSVRHSFPVSRQLKNRSWYLMKVLKKRCNRLQRRTR